MIHGVRRRGRALGAAGRRGYTCSESPPRALKIRLSHGGHVQVPVSRSWRYILTRAALITWFALLLVVSASGLALLSYSARYAGRIYRGVSIAGLDVGGLFPEEALANLGEWVSDKGLPYLSLRTAEQDWTLSSGDLGGYVDQQKVVQAAWFFGRTGVFRDDLPTRLRLLWWGYDLVPDFRVEPGQALTDLRQIARQAGHPARHAQLWVAGLQARAGESVVGRELDIPQTIEAIEESVRRAMGESRWGTAPLPRLLLEARTRSPSRFPTEPVPVTLAFREIVPPITQVLGAEQQAGAILGDPLELSFDFPQLQPDGTETRHTRRWSIDRATLASWLVVHRAHGIGGMAMQVSVDRAKIMDYVLDLADEVSCAPREPRHDYDAHTGRLNTLLPGQNGYALDITTAQDMIADACASRERKITLPITVLRPRVSRTVLEAMLPLSLIGEGQSSFKGSSPARLRNIRLASERFHGVVVPARSTFSFLHHLGLVTVANGYSESWIILGDRTVLGPGGGVCQVSTTCFRAAFWAGLPIVERRAHTYRVSWYEPPIGFDAAVFTPSVDFQFENDSDSPILVQTQVDETNSKLFFRFYSRPIGRKVTMDGPVTANPIRAGESVLELDPSLPAGERVQVDWPHDGIDVTLYRILEREGEDVTREKIFTRYEPWPARYRVGPTE